MDLAEWTCPQCDHVRTGRFCELDGYDSELPPAVSPVGWLLIVTADRRYHEFVRDTGNANVDRVTFPEFCPERRFRLRGKELLIGRRSASRGIVPQIDLIGPPEDPAIGHAHAVLVAQPDGAWAVTDLGSRNGTYLNYGTSPVAARVSVPVVDGDQIHVGCWTTLTLRSG
jgi:FHA domain-containing protein